MRAGHLTLAVLFFGLGCGDSTSPPGPSQLGITLDELSVTAGQQFSLEVAIQDPSGNTVTSSTAAVTIALAPSPSSGPPVTLLGDLQVNAVNGVATFDGLQINTARQGLAIIATSSGLPTATSAAFQIVPGAATKIGFITQPSTVAAGAPFLIQVAVQDQYDNVVTSATGGATLALATNPGNATLSGTTTAAFAFGIAAFADISLDKAANGYTISATSGSFDAITSAAVTVNPGAPVKLAFLPIGATYQSAALIGSPLRVRILDAHDNVVVTAVNSVTLSIGANPASGTLSAVGGAAGLTKTPFNGEVDFTGASIDKVGSGYTLVASAASLTSATSSAFNITPGMPTKLVWVDKPATSANAGVIIPEFRIALHDAAGNLVNDQAGYFVHLNVLSGPTGGKLVGFGGQSKAPVDGIATFNTIRFSRAGTYVFRATSGVLTPVDSDPIAVQLAFAKVTVGGGPTFSAPITEARHACSLSTMGALHCWGGSVWAAMGIETSNAQASVLEPELVVTNLLFKDVDAGNIHSCAVTTAGAAYCWGSNLNGRSGNGDPQQGTKATPFAVSGGLHFVSISAGDKHTCGVTSSGPGVLSGPVYCWGSNTNGELGDGTFAERATPTLVSGGLAFIAVSASHGAHTCGITTDFLAYCWGSNADGQLGDASTTTRNAPTLVQNAGTHLFRSISTGRFHTCAVRADNAAYCWGGNTSQQLGDGNTDQSDRTSPSLVTAAMSAVAGGWLHTCGIGGGTAQCWGANDAGQLGDGGATTRNAPGAVSGSLNITQVAAGQDFSCGVTADSRIYCWGLNEFGQLGDGTTIQRLAPVRVLP